ncbi:MAG: hypothetical protein J6T26_04855 [Firmicutes bacterium]|nr:hypothetical protein [Bacillota bacterium]
MDAYGASQLERLQKQFQQLQNLMGQPSQPVDLPQPTAQKPTVTISSVDGIEGARKFAESVGPNSKVVVFDGEEPVFYTFAVDANGNRGTIKIGRFTLEDAPEPGDNTITKDDLDAFKAEIRGMLAALVNKEAEA